MSKMRRRIDSQLFFAMHGTYEPMLRCRCSTVVSIGDPVSVVLFTSDLNPPYIVSESNANYFIVHPSFLLTATNISTSFHCIRRSILSTFLSSSEGNIYSLLGQMRHKLFEYGSSLPFDFKKAVASPYIIHNCHKYILSLIRENTHMIYEVGAELCSVYESLHACIPGIIEWIAYLHQDNSSLKRVENCEDCVWCPSLGLKGVIDITCEVDTKDGTLRVPVEIKTGKEDPISHSAQVYLYSLMLASFPDNHSLLSPSQDVSSVLVYVKSEPLNVYKYYPTAHNDILNELNSGAKGPYIDKVLSTIRIRSEAVFKHQASFLTKRFKPLQHLYLSNIVLRRNLLASYILRVKGALGLDSSCGESNDIEDLLSFSHRIDEVYQDLSLPEECGNSVFCEQCGCFPLCKLLSLSKMRKGNGAKDAYSVKERCLQNQKSLSCQSQLSISYFKKWVRLDGSDSLLDVAHSNGAFGKPKERPQYGDLESVLDKQSGIWSMHFGCRAAENEKVWLHVFMASLLLLSIALGC